jgi:hypothetical protein
VAVVRAAHGQKALAWSETDPGSVTIALGRAQFSVQFFSNYSKIAHILEFKFAAFLNSKNVQNLQDARYEVDKQLCPLAQLNNPTGIQVIIFGINSTLNFSLNF